MSFFGTLFSSKNTAPKSSEAPLTLANPEITLSVRTMQDDLVETGLRTPNKTAVPTALKPSTTPNPFTEEKKDHSNDASSTNQELESFKKTWTNRDVSEPKKIGSTLRNQNTLKERVLLNQLGGSALGNEKETFLPKGKFLASPPKTGGLGESSSLAHTAPSSRSIQSLSGYEKPLSASQQGPMRSQAPSLHFPAWFFKIGVGVFVLLMLGGGVWYWKQILSLPPSNQNPDVNPPSITPHNQIPTQPQQVFKLSGPNELSFNTRSVTAEQIRSTLIDAEQKVKDNNIVQPIAFQITDEQHNPVSFFVFTKWFSIGLSPEIITTLDETFTLYLYNDSGYVHIGLDIKSKDVSQTTGMLTKNESGLAQSMAAIFLNGKVSPPANAQFKIGNYNGIPTHYFNFPSPEAPFDGGLSLDYSLVNQHLTMATSKQTNRAIIDIVSGSSINK